MFKLIPSNKFLFKSLIKRYFTSKITSEKEALELVESGIFEVLKSTAKCRVDKLDRKATFEELGKIIFKEGFDSLDQVELVTAFEEKFGVEVTDEESLKIQSVLDAIQIMHSAYVKTNTSVGTEVENKNENLPEPNKKH